MLLTKEVEVGLCGKNIKHYEDLGYKIPRKINKDGGLSITFGTKIKVKVEDLTKGSHVLVNIKCDCCGEKLLAVNWQTYKNHKDGKTYCHSCANKLSVNKIKKIRLLKGQSLGYWLIKNLSLKEAINIIARWDIELNKCDIREVSYGSHGIKNKGYWFKCLKHIEHKSELKIVRNFITGCKNSLCCDQCNSFGMWGIQYINKDFLNKYWDYEKNDKLNINPWMISFGNSLTKIWIKCQENFKCHGSYSITCANFKNGNRCPKCSSSKGENRIINYLINNEFVKITSNEYNLSTNRYKSDNRYYIPQKQYGELLGLGDRNLSYDFYLPKYNLLIEYQGEQHERPINFKGKEENGSEEKFKRQQEHDRRKKQYAIDNNINLLEIWYWDFDNVEKILGKELNIINKKKVKLRYGKRIKLSRICKFNSIKNICADNCDRTLPPQWISL